MKKRFTAVIGQGNLPTSGDDVEDNSPLPYVRLSRRSHRTNTNMSEADMIECLAIREIIPDRLLATKRIINAFNSGDIEVIHDIINDSVLDTCEIYFSNLQHVFIGRAALFSLWSSLFDAFPNGIFRTSDSVINEKKQVFTSFLFFGTKIFPLLIDGMPLEAVTMANPIENANASAGSVSVKVDRGHPMFTTSELLEAETIPEMVFEGRIVLHMNEQCKIRKFDFAWNRKM